MTHSTSEIKNLFSLLLQYADDITLCIDSKGNIKHLNSTAIHYLTGKCTSLPSNNLFELCQNGNIKYPLSFFNLSKKEMQTHQEMIHRDAHETGIITWKYIPGELENIPDMYILTGKMDMQKNQDTTDHLHKIVDCTPGSLYWKDKNGRYLGCNQFMANIAGLTSIDDIIGKTDEELWPQQAEQLSRNDQQVIHSGQTICTEEAVNVNGKIMYFIGVKAPLKNTRGDIIGIIGNSLDITELKETQAQLQHEKQHAEADNHAKSEFIANMSHDIRTPLAGIIGLTEILISSLKNSAIVKFAKDAHHSANQLMQLLNEILEVSDIAAGNITDQRQDFTLTSIIKNMKELMSPSAEYKGLTLYIEHDSRIPDKLNGYRILLHRVLLNLVSNAIKFTTKGNVTLTTHLVKKSQEKVHIRFCIADTGIGIPEDKVKFIFEPFKRLTPSYENNYQGTGLGLYVVKKFLDIMGGTLNVTSILNQGSVFEFTLSFNIIHAKTINPQPIPSLAASHAQMAHSIDQPQTFSFNNNQTHYPYRALVVEDDTTAQIVSRVQLNKQNCCVDIASTSHDAILLFKKNHYDLVLMDIGLPDKNGCETSVILRAYEQEHKKTHTPIIALTAHINQKNHQACLAAGIDRVLQKPFSQQVAEKIATAYFTAQENNQQPLDKAIINLTEAKAIFGGNQALMQEILTLFINSLAQEVQHIHHCYHQKNWHALQQATHKLSGGASYCGALRLKTACFKLEALLKQDEIAHQKVSTCYHQVLQEISAIQKFAKIFL